MSEGKIVSPIYREDYCFNNYADLFNGLKEFDNILANRIDSNYMSLIQDLYAIKPEIHEEVLDKIAEQYNNNRYTKKTLEYYKTLWHLHKD